MATARIMIVEDEVVIALDLRSRVENLGHTVVANVVSGEAAVASAEKQHPDLVLMDIKLAGEIDGIEAAEIVRSRWHIPIVFVTAHADEQRLGRAKLTMPFGYLLKPINDRELRVTIEMALYVAEVDRARDLLLRQEQLTAKVLQALNQTEPQADVISEILSLIKEHTGFEAVGIRLQEGEDFPYYETRGFPEHFVEAERYLCARDRHGDLVRDSNGNVYVECMCGNILCGRTDPSSPFFSEGGSFFSNATSVLLAETTEEERQARTRNRCNGEGYETVTLVPLRSREGVIGLLQLNDTRPGMVTPALVAFLEGLGTSIGIAFHKRQTEGALRERVKELDCLFAVARLVEKEGVSLADIIQGVADLIPGAWQYPDVTCAKITVDESEHKTEGFRRTEWRQEAAIVCDGTGVGRVEVCYLEKRSDRDEGPFLRDERNLIEALAERLGRIVERHRAREAKIESAERLRLMADSLPAYIAYVDSQRRYQFNNKQYEKLFGIRLAEIQGMTVEELVGEAVYEQIREDIDQALAGQGVQRERRVTLENGKSLVNQTSYVPQIADHGEVKGFFVFSHDVRDERKRREEAVRESEAPIPPPP